MKPAAKRSPAPVVSTSLATGIAGAARTWSAVTTTQPLLAARHGAEHALLLELRDGRVDSRFALVKARQLRLVGEEDVDRAAADEAEELVAVAADAEGVGQAERDAPAGRAGDARRLDEGRLGGGRVPQSSLRGR